MDPLQAKAEPTREFCGASLEMYLNKSRKCWESGRESQRKDGVSTKVRGAGDASGWGRYPWRGCSPCGCEDPHQSRGRVRGKSNTNCGRTAEGSKSYPRKFQIPLDIFQCALELTIDNLCTAVLESGTNSKQQHWLPGTARKHGKDWSIKKKKKMGARTLNDLTRKGIKPKWQINKNRI